MNVPKSVSEHEKRCPKCADFDADVKLTFYAPCGRAENAAAKSCCQGGPHRNSTDVESRIQSQVYRKY
jgi:hypothetical protein